MVIKPVIYQDAFKIFETEVILVYKQEIVTTVATI